MVAAGSYRVMNGVCVCDSLWSPLAIEKLLGQPYRRLFATLNQQETTFDSCNRLIHSCGGSHVRI